MRKIIPCYQYYKHAAEDNPLCSPTIIVLSKKRRKSNISMTSPGPAKPGGRDGGHGTSTFLPSKIYCGRVQLKYSRY